MTTNSYRRWPRNGNRTHELRTAPRSGGRWTHLTRLPGGDFELHPRDGGVVATNASTTLWVAKDARRPRRTHQQTTPLVYLTSFGEELFFVTWVFDERAKRHDELFRMPLAGGEPRLVTRMSLGSAPVVDSAFVYYRAEQGGLQRVSLDGGSPRTLVAPPSPGGNGAGQTAGASWALVALDAAHAYFAEPDHGLVRRISRQGGRASLVARIADVPRVLAVDASHVYVGTDTSDGSPPRLLRVVKSGREPPIELTELGAGAATSLALSESHVFGIAGGTLFRIPKVGGAVEALRESVCDLTLDGDWAFFADCVAFGTVWRLQLSNHKLSALSTHLTTPRFPVASEGAVHWITTGAEVSGTNPHVFGCCAVWSYDL